MTRDALKGSMEPDGFTRLVQYTGYILIVGVILFWAFTNRVSIEVIGAATTLLCFGAGRTALKSLSEGRHLE